MAHNCPECYAVCHCGGDIDDILFDDDSPEAFRCIHWAQCEDDDPDYDDEYWTD